MDKNNMTDQNVITFSGNNEQLFTKKSLAGMINPKLTLIVPETHNAILIKDGQMLQTLSSGKYLVSKFVDQKTDANADIQILFMSKHELKKEKIIKKYLQSQLYIIKIKIVFIIKR